MRLDELVNQIVEEDAARHATMRRAWIDLLNRRNNLRPADAEKLIECMGELGLSCEDVQAADYLRGRYESILAHGAEVEVCRAEVTRLVEENDNALARDSYGQFKDSNAAVAAGADGERRIQGARGKLQRAESADADAREFRLAHPDVFA